MTDGDFPMVRRVRAAQATLDTWSTRPLKLGTSDCVRMVASHLRRLGYRVKLPPSGSYRTVPGALKALAAAGHASIADALDALGLARIPPAAAAAGDVLLLPATDRLGSLAVAVGNGRVVAYHEDVVGAAVLQPVAFVAAWRVDPR
jgi:hypothetical protein